MIAQKVELFFREHPVFQDGKKIVLGVSGGPDSVAMLHLFATEFAPKYSLQIAAAHLNHMLRARESDEDEELVRELCERWKVPCCAERRDVKADKKVGDSLENHARRIRYAFFRKVKEQYGAHHIATAHTEDDQVETILMRIMTGSGPSGLRGILAERTDGVIRPFLHVKRKEIERYLEEKSIPYCTDRSNRDTKYLRNRIRHEILPQLRCADRSVDEDLLVLAGEACRDWEQTGKKIQAEAGSLIRKENGYLILDLHNPLCYPTYVLRDFLGAVLARPTRKHIEALHGLMQKQPGRLVKLPQGYEAWRTANEIRVQKKCAGLLDQVYECAPGEEVRLAERGLIAQSWIEQARPSFFPEDSATEAYFDADKVGDRWRLRTWKHGDRLHPLGLAGRKKISDLLCEKKIPLPERRNALVMETANGIAWVVGVRIGEDFKVAHQTKYFLHVQLLHIGE